MAVAVLGVVPIGGNSAAAANSTFKVLNPSAEMVKGAHPVHWGYYGGTGSGEWGVSSEARTGKHAVYLKAKAYHKFRRGPNAGREVIGLALTVGASDGYRGPNAYPCKPNTEYRFSFWLKGDLSRVRSRALGWKTNSALSGDRQYIETSLGTIEPTAEWQCYEGAFTTKEDTKKFVLMIEVAGRKDEGMSLGVFQVDDVTIDEVFSVGVYKAGSVAGYKGVAAALAKMPGVKAEYTKSLTLKSLTKYHALVIPDCKAVGAGEPPWWMDCLRSYVEECGGAVLLYHDSVGYMRSPFSGRDLFPEVALGGGDAGKETNWPKPYEIVLADNDHFITKELGEIGGRFPIMYVDVMTTKAGPEGTVLFKTPKGACAVIAGQVGKGRVVFNGTIVFNRPPRKYDSFMEGETDQAHGIDKDLLVKTVQWFAARPRWIDRKAVDKALARFREKRRESKTGKAEICIIPTPQKVQEGKKEILLFADNAAKAMLVVGEKSDSRVMAGAEAVREKVAELGGRIEIKRPNELAETDLAGHNLIVLGGRDENSLSAALIEAHGEDLAGDYLPSSTNPGKEGYIIKALRNAQGRDCILGAGSDLQGTMYAAYSICYTIFKKADRIVAKTVSVWDKPDFEYRSMGCFLRSKTKRENLDNARKMVDWYSRHKINVVEDQSFFYRRLPSELKEDEYEKWRAIKAYAKTKGVMIGYSGSWKLVRPLPEEKCMVYDKTKLAAYCWANQRMWNERDKELSLLMEKLSPEIFWWHSIDGRHAQLENHFEHRCPECRKMFQRRSRAEAYYVNRLYKTMRKYNKDTIIGMCIIPYDSNPASPHKQEERAFFEEVGSLIPDDVLLVLRENSRQAFQGYRDVTGKDTYLYQAHYHHYDSRQYTGLVKVFCTLDWLSYADLNKIARADSMWKAGSSFEISDELLERMCAELYGREAAPYMAAVLIPDYRLCGKKFSQMATLDMARRMNFDTEYLEERLSELDDALENLEKAEKVAAGFFPALTFETIEHYKANVQTMKRWGELLLLKEKKDPAFAKACADFQTYLKKAKPVYWTTYLKTTRGMK